jgi:type IV fimbrial biogenesis protein FimT
MNKRIKKWIKGFTLVELMVSLGVAAIIITLGVPSFREFTASSRLSSRVNNFVGDLIIARNEAIKRNTNVFICKRESPNYLPPSCTTAGGWEQGWVIFLDDDDDKAFDAGETILRLADEFGDNITLRGNNPVKDRISFEGTGIATNGSLIFCDTRIETFEDDKAKARVVIISKSGRIRTVKGNDSSSSLSSCTPS